jgi:hypothetical protein
LELALQVRDALLQRRDEGIALGASRATRLAHASSLPEQALPRDPSSRKALGGYLYLNNA